MPGRNPLVRRAIETDYLVVGAGAMGMAFTDALIDHADVHVTLCPASAPMRQIQRIEEGRISGSS